MKNLLLFVFILTGVYTLGRSGEQAVPVAAHQLFFIANQGQWPGEVKYLAKSAGVNIWVTSHGLVYDYYRYEFSDDQENKFKADHLNGSVEGHVVAMTFGCNLREENFLPREKQKSYYNYFLGNDPSRWAAAVPLYKAVTLKNVWSGIDMELYADHGNLRYDFVLWPGADPRQINLLFEGADDLMTENGNLVIKTSIGDKIQGDIHAFQEDAEVDCRIEVSGGAVRFEPGNYDVTKPLRIDPLIYSTYLGGNSNDIAYDVVIGDNEKMFLTGSTWSPDFPTTTGAYQGELNGAGDAFVSCFSADGQDLIFSTFLGGSYNDYAQKLAYNSGNIILTGVAYSEDFPITSGAFQDVNHLGGDVFVTSVSNNGQNLNFSTYVGGFGFDAPVDMTTGDYILVGGYTSAGDFPVTADAYDPAYGGGSPMNDGFVFKMSFSGGMIYSSYFGGWADDKIKGVALDPASPSVYYLTGLTGSDDFPVTDNAFDDQLGDGSGSGQDAFVAKFNNNQLMYSTYLGGSATDEASGIAVNSGYLVMVAGTTYSDDFPVTPDAFSSQRQGVYQDAFVTVLDPHAASSNDELVYGSYFGGTFEEEVSDVLLENNDKLYITGYTSSQNFPVTPGAVSQEHTGNADAFVTRFNFSGNHLDYSTYLGGSFNDVGYGMAYLQENQIALSGLTMSFNFPVTADAYQPDYINENFSDAFLSVIGIVPTGIAEDPAAHRGHISQNQPNPFRSVTTISYRLDTPGDLTLEVYDCTGKKVLEQSYTSQTIGEHRVKLDMSGFTPGLYFYSLRTGQWTESLKMVIE